MAHQACLVLLLAVGSFALPDSVSEDGHFLSTIMERFHDQMDEHAKDLEDLLTDGSEVKDLVATEDGSREEIEEDKGAPADSASQESGGKEDAPAPKDPAPQDSDDEDDTDDDEDGLEIPFRRGLSGLFGLHGLFGMSKPWWTGPNVCVDRDEKEDKTDAQDEFLVFGSAHFSNCINSPDKYTCKTITKRRGITRTSTVTYSCCHGFRRTQESYNCTKAEVSPVSEQAAKNGAERFLELARSAGLEHDLEGKVTVFLPLDSALDEHHATIDSLNSIDPVLTNEVPLSGGRSGGTKEEERAFVLGHVVQGPHEASDLSDEQVLTTMGNTTIRINSIPGGRGFTANCLRLNKTDLLTENGVAHVVEGAMAPVRESLAEVLSEERFSKFRQMLEENDMWEMMSGKKPLTVFAVENEGVEKISSKHKMCMKNILAHHILPYTLCSATADSATTLVTLDISRTWLPFTALQDERGLLIGNDTNVRSVDNMATNGVMHLAEKFSIPNGGRTVSELLGRTNYTEWLKVLEKSGLLDEIESTANITMFIPSNRAVQDAKLSELSDSELKDLVKYHTGTSQSGSTVATLLDSQNLTITTQRSMFPGLMSNGRSLAVQCSPLVRMGGRVCNGMVHEVRDVLRPPTQTLWERVRSDERLSTLRKVLADTKLETELKSGLDRELTFLAPTDEAFQTLEKDVLEKLTSDKEFADSVIRSHVINEVLCCSNAVPNSWPFVSSAQTLAPGRSVEVNRLRGVPTFSGVSATDCDLLATDGNLILVSGVRLGSRDSPAETEREFILRRPNSEIILAGL